MGQVTFFFFEMPARNEPSWGQGKLRLFFRNAGPSFAEELEEEEKRKKNAQ
jgi:hypothetical protein